MAAHACEPVSNVGRRVPGFNAAVRLLQQFRQWAVVGRRQPFGSHSRNPPIYDPDADPAGLDGGFEVSEQATFHTVVTIWQDEITHARVNCAARGLDDTSPFMGARVSLRWIYTHMIGEYARHSGHADLIRERIDGATGV